MPLLNVRLKEEDAKLVRNLRRQGVQISELVRMAIRSEHESRAVQKASRRDAATIVEKIFEDHPDTPDVRPRALDLTDRAAVRRALVKRLRR